MNNDKLFKRAICLCEYSECENGEKQVRLLDKSIKILQKLIESEPEDAEYFYVLGLCWYRHPVSSPERTSRVEGYLKKALNLSPEHQFARLYLGHLNFDERRYGEALERFESVNPDFFEEFGQRWRVLKLEELILCCRLYLNPQEIWEKDVEDLCQIYEATGRIDAPVPLEIVDCFNHLCQNRVVQPAHYSGMAERILKMISRVEFERALSDRIANLKECYAV